MGIRWYHLFFFAAGVMALAFFMLPGKREEGILLARSDKPEEALRLLREVIDKNPNDTVAVLELAEGLMHAGDSVTANRILKKWMAGRKDLSKYRYRLARIFEAGFEFEEAIRLLAGVKDPDYKHLIELCVRAGMLDRAVEFLREEVKAKGVNEELLKKIAQYQQWQLNIKGAGKAIEELAEFKPISANIYEAMNFYYWRGDNAKMKEFAGKLTKFDDLTANQLRTLRTVWINLVEIKEAIDTAKKVIVLKDSTEQDWNDYAALLDWNGETRQALAVAEEATDKFKDSDASAWQAVAFARKLNKDAVAAKYLYKLGKKTGRDDLIRAAADSYAQSGAEKEAIEIYKKLAYRNHAVYDLLRLATLYNKTNNKEEAKKYAGEFYKQVLIAKESEITTDVLAEGAYLLESVGLNKERNYLLRQLAARGDDDARLLLAGIYYDAGNTEKALEVLRGIGDSAPGKVRREAATRIAFILSDEYYQQADQSKAKELRKQAQAYADKAIALYKEFKPENGGGDDYQGLLSIRFDFAIVEKDLTTAAAMLAQMKNPGDAQYVELAAAYAEGGDNQKAKETAEKVRKVDSLEAGMIGQLAGMYLAVEENSKALELYEMADRKAAGKDKEIRLGLAAAYGANGDFAAQYKIYDYYAGSKDAKALDVIAAADARGANNDLVGETKVLRGAIGRFPQSAIIRARLISNIYAMGFYSEAKEISWGLEGLRIHKRLNEILIVANALMDVGQLREAGRMLKAGEKLEDPELELVLAQARYLTAEKKFKDALNLYIRYLSKKPKMAGVWFDLAQLKTEMGLWGAREDAITAREILFSGKLKTSADWMLASGIKSFLGQRKDALVAMKNASLVQPEAKVINLEMAALYNTYGLPMLAENELSGLGAESGIDRAARERATALIGQRKFVLGLKELKKYVAANEDEADARADMAGTENDLGLTKDAVRDYNMAREIINREAIREIRRVFIPQQYEQMISEEKPEAVMFNKPSDLFDINDLPENMEEMDFDCVYRQSFELQHKVVAPVVSVAVPEDLPLPEFIEGESYFVSQLKARALLAESSRQVAGKKNPQKNELLPLEQLPEYIPIESVTQTPVWSPENKTRNNGSDK